MSRNINVNPDHYKVAGRERQGEAINQSLQKQQFAEQQAANARWQAKHNGPPPWEATVAQGADGGEAKSLKGQKTKSLRERRLKGPTTQRPKARKAPSRAVPAKGARRRRAAATRPARKTKGTTLKTKGAGKPRGAKRGAAASRTAPRQKRR